MLCFEAFGDGQSAEDVAAGHDSAVIVFEWSGGDGADFTLHLGELQKLTGHVGIQTVCKAADGRFCNFWFYGWVCCCC